MTHNSAGLQASHQSNPALIGHARQRHGLIGCSETRTVSARRVRDTRIPVRVRLFVRTGDGKVASSFRVHQPTSLHLTTANSASGVA